MSKHYSAPHIIIIMFPVKERPLQENYYIQSTIIIKCRISQIGISGGGRGGGGGGNKKLKTETPDPNIYRVIKHRAQHDVRNG